MNEDKFLQSLFDQAKQEEPKLSFEVVSDKFQASMPLNLIEGLRVWLTKHISLNIFVALITASSLAVAFWINTSTSEEATLVEKEIEYQTPIIEGTPKLTQDLLIKTPIEEPEMVLIAKENEVKINKNNKAFPEETHNPISRREEIVSIEDSTNNIEPSSISLEIKEDKQKSLPVEVASNSFEIPVNQEDSSLTLVPEKIPSNKPIAIAKDKLIVGGETVNDPDIIKEEDVERTEVLIVKRTDRLEDCDKFIEQLNKRGLITKNSSFKEINGEIHRMLLRLSHKKGLNFRVRSKGFKQFQIQFHYDKKDQLLGISYSFNDRPFGRIQSISAKGKVQYLYRNN